MAAPGTTFMESPLVVWCHTFQPDKPLTYEQLFDGAYLNQVMKDIDSKCVTDGISLTVEDVRDRIHNWDILLKNIKAYYKEVLQQIIVMKLPNIITISKNPESDVAREEMTRTLLLILGCAIQSEMKEIFIENIKSLDIEIQHAIMEYIKEITDDTKNVFAIEIPLDHLDEMSCSMFTHLNMLVQERDGYLEEIKELTQTLEEVYRMQQAAQHELQAQKTSLGLSPGTSGTHGTSSTTPEKHHLAVELAETKAKLRRLRQELEEKTEIISELQEELEEVKAMASKLRTENLELIQDARAARTYRDEVDILREKASRVEKYELEISRYKEKLNELDFYKARVEELREDNQVLIDTKLHLEEQLESSHKRIEAVLHIEEDLIKYKQQVQELVQERDRDRQKIQELTEIVAHLEFEKKSSFNENANLEEELVKARRQLNVGLSTSINEQVSNSSNSKILRLELEKQKLQQQLDELQETAALESNARLLELQKENLRLSKKVESLQESSSKELQSVLDLEQKSLSLTREREQLEQAIETVKETSERQIQELQRENNNLQQTVATLRARNEKSRDACIKDMERENRRLHDAVNSCNAKLSQLEFEKQQLQKKCDRFDETTSRIQELEEVNLKFEHQNDDLTKRVATLQLTCDKYEKVEQDASDLRIENAKLTKKVENLQATITKLKALEQDNINLTVETQHLQRTIKTMKNSSSHIMNLEQEKHELNEQIQHLTRTLETYKMECAKQEQLESDMYDLDTENQKLQRSLEGANRKLEALQKENSELESKSAQLQKMVENMKMSTRKVDSLMKDSQELEAENVKLNKVKDNVEKENRRLKNTMEKQHLTIDELTNKVTSLERENKNLKKLGEDAEELTQRLEESEQENTELVRQSAMDRKALTALREDLVSEKLKNQQLSNDLEKLSTELNRLGLNRDKLMAAGQAEDDSKIKALESMLDDTFKQSLEIKEQKIHALESRLNESMNRNREIQDELRQLRSQNEALLQRREEERHVKNSPRVIERRGLRHITQMSAPNNTKEILELKDHIISVERKNATLEAECQNGRTQVNQLQDRLKHAEAEVQRLHNQLSKLQEKNSSLQDQLVKHQVDNKTLQSQNASLMSQNSMLQKDCNKLEMEKERLISNYEDLNSKHEEYMSDHATLERLHEQVTKEYEEMISEHGSLKANYKSLKHAYEELVDQNAAMSRERQAIAQLKQIIEEDQKNIRSDNDRLLQLQAEYVKLKEENVNLQNDNGKLDRRYAALMSDHKSLKQEYNNLRLKLSELQREYGECKDQLNTMDIEINKLINKCESLNQMNVKLEEDNRALMMQLQALLTQNQELLLSSLQSKDHFHKEQKSYIEKMAELRRQKEKLEEKIMEQYKRYDPVKKKSRGFGANLMKRARQMVSRNKSRERCKTPADSSFAPDSAENSSMGSGSISENVEQGERGRPKVRRGRLNHRRRGGSNLLSKQNKAIAKSTTALNVDTGPSRAVYALRGAKSTENLSAEIQRRSDGESLSSSSDVRNAEWSSRPSRRRALMAGSSSSSLRASEYRQPGSVSSEDTRSSVGQQSDPPTTPKTTTRNIATGYENGADDDDDDDDDDGLITLSEFLSEVNKSPKSRRKYIEKQIDDVADKTLNKETSILSPELGARSPLIENEAKPSSKLKSRIWKSEANISQLSRINSDGSAFTTYDRRHQIQPQFSMVALSTSPNKTEQVTSTPMAASYRPNNVYGSRNSAEANRDNKSQSATQDSSFSQEQSRNSEGSYYSEHDRSYLSADRQYTQSTEHKDQSSSTPAHRLFYTNNSHGHEERPANDSVRYTNGPYAGGSGGGSRELNTSGNNRNINNIVYGQQNGAAGPTRPVSSLGIPVHQSPPQQDYQGSRAVERSRTPNMTRQSSASSVGSGNIGAYNAMTRQTSSGGLSSHRPDDPRLHNTPTSGRSLAHQQCNANEASNVGSHPAASSYRNDNKHHQDSFSQLDGSLQSSGSPQWQNTSRYKQPLQQDSSQTSSPYSRDNSSMHYSGSSHNNSTTSIGQNNNKYNHPDQSYIPGSGHRSLPRPPVNEASSGYPPPMRPQHNNLDKDGDMLGSYNPGNVRSLVHNYQRTQQSLSGQMSSEDTGHGPVPPPRRIRPMSAGPIQSGSGSAFSVPPRSTTPGIENRTSTPAIQDSSRPHSAHPNGGGRSLPQPPTDRQMSATVKGPAGNNTASRTQSAQGGKTKSHIWYEYGCV